MNKLSLRLPSTAMSCVAAGLLLAAAPAWSLYKVVGPDGRVTYTDRPDTTNTQSRVVTMNPASGTVGVGGNGAGNVSLLPLELRQVAARYPVSLYVGSSCEPCDLGRGFLNQRGVPFIEKQVLSNDDSEALEKLTGGREAPTLMIGTQVVRGFTSDLWGSYLDAAGYPRESRLPSSYQQPAPTPLVVRQAPPQMPGTVPQPFNPASPMMSAPSPAPAPAPANPTGIRF
jgi:glutaredoxin